MSSNYPDGALDDPRAPFNQPDAPTIYVCENCDWSGETVEPLRHADQRVAPGEPMPAGECPECGACCHELEE